jgi:hypothetical protein
MALLIGTIILWIAGISRVVTSIRRPDPARISMTIATVCIAAALTLTPSLTGAAINDLLGLPEAAELIQHLLLTVAAYATLRLLMLFRLGAIPRRTEIVQAVMCSAVCGALIALFTAITFTTQTAAVFTQEYGGNLAAVLYRAVFYSYLIYCLIGITVVCVRNLRSSSTSRSNDPESTATAVSLAAIAIGSVAAIITALSGLIVMIERYQTGEPAGFWAYISAIGVATAAVFIGFGIIAPIPVEAFLRWRQASRSCATLADLWAGLTDAVPDVVLPIPATRSPLSRAELASTRQRIEIADALHRIRIDRDHAAAIQQHTNPPTALGWTLRDQSTWTVTGRTGIVAAELLEVRPDSELQQLLAVAAGYRTTS